MRKSVTVEFVPLYLIRIIHISLSIILAKHFYAIVQSEENTIDFLKERGLIEIGTPPCVHCGSQTKFYTRKERGKERTVIRCTKKGCQRTQSVRKGNTFFTYTDKNGQCNSGHWSIVVTNFRIIILLVF